MSGPFNGYLRHAIITACVAAIFGLFSWVLLDFSARLKFLEEERVRTARIVADRGRRLDESQACCNWCRDRIVELQLDMAREHHRRP